MIALDYSEYICEILVVRGREFQRLPLRDINIFSLQPHTFHKSSHNHRKGSVTQLMTFADVSQNRLCPLPILYIVSRYSQQLFVTCHIHIIKRSPMFPSMFLSSYTMGNYDVSPNCICSSPFELQSSTLPY